MTPEAVTAARALTVRYRGLVYRAIHLRHFAPLKTARPLYAAGGGAAGTRYVPPHGPAALYAALDPATAYREVNQGFFRVLATATGRRLARAGDLRPPPLVTIGVYVRAARLLDLRDRPTRRALGIRSEKTILGPWLGVDDAPTQVLGRLVHADGWFEGILYPSAQTPGRSCVVLFPGRLLRTSVANVRDAATGLKTTRPSVPRGVPR